MKRGRTILCSTVLVWIVAAKQNSCSITSCNFIEPANHCACRTLTKVLLKDRGFIAVDEDWVMSGWVTSGVETTYCALSHAWP